MLIDFPQPEIIYLPKNKDYPETNMSGSNEEWLSFPIQTLNDALLKLIMLISDQNQLFERISYSIQIMDLNNDKYFLNCPISVIVYFENSQFYAELIDFDIFGEGLTEKDAIDNLKEVFIVYFESLINKKGKLSKKLALKAKLIKSLIRK